MLSLYDQLRPRGMIPTRHTFFHGFVSVGRRLPCYKVWNAWAGPPFKEICLQTMAEHRGGITALAFAGDATLISTSRDGSVRLWRPQRGRRLLRFPFFCCVKRLSVNSFVRGVASRPAGERNPPVGQKDHDLRKSPTTTVDLNPPF